MKDQLISLAKNKIKAADHMLTQTYPLIKDPKILVAVVNGLFVGCDSAMNAVLNFERKYKRIPLFSTHFEHRFELFNKRVSPRYGFVKDEVRVIKILNEIIQEHKRAPMEFARRDKFVICNDSYQMRTINVSQIKKYINLSRLLVEHCSKILE